MTPTNKDRPSNDRHTKRQLNMRVPELTLKLLAKLQELETTNTGYMNVSQADVVVKLIHDQARRENLIK